jgi:hypothetical protein
MLFKSFAWSAADLNGAGKKFSAPAHFPAQPVEN